MALPKYKPPFRNQNTGEQRRRDIERVADMSVDVTIVHGKILTFGTGENTLDITFPVVYCEMPTLSFGSSTDEDTNQYVTLGAYPTTDVTVISWVREKVTDSFEGYYRGCTLAFMVEGKADQRLLVHWQMIGRAMRNPTNSLGELEQEL